MRKTEGEKVKWAERKKRVLNEGERGDRGYRRERDERGVKD